METIFDYNVTQEELARFVGPYDVDSAMSEGSAMYSSENDANYALGILFSMRGDLRKSKEYFDKVKNPEILKTLIQDF